MRKNLLANYSGMSVVALSQIIVIPFYIKVIGQSGWGELSAVLSWSASFLLIEAGVSLALSRYFSLNGQAARSILTAELRRTEKKYWLMLGPVAGIALALLLFLHYWEGIIPEVRGSNKITLAGLLLSAAQMAGAPYRGALVGLGHQVVINVVLIFFTISRQLAAILVASYSQSVLCVVLTLSVFFFFEALLRRLLIYRKLYAKTTNSDLSHGPEIAVPKRTGYLVFATISGALTTQADRLVLSRHLPPAEFGHYSIAVILSLSVLQFIYPVTQALLPRMGTLKFATAERQAKAIVLCFIVIWATIAVFGGRVLAWWLANSELADFIAPLLSLHFLGTLVNALSVPFHILLLARHRDRNIFFLNTFALLAQLLVLFGLVKYFGEYTGVISWVGVSLVMSVGYYYLAKRASPCGQGLHR